MFKRNLVKSLIVVSVVFSPSLLTHANAASSCKGLDHVTCDESSLCGWVKSYTRKDGREVSAFCRTSSKGKSKISEAEGNLKKAV